MLENFPKNLTPNQIQTDVIPKISKAFETKKFVILSAPTGSGKSVIAKTLANSTKECTEKFKNVVLSYDAYQQDYKGVYVNEDDCLKEGSFGCSVLTVTKTLQDQYLNLFNDTSILKGKNNYVCKVDENFPVDTAPCVFVNTLKSQCWKENKCLYYNARNEAVISKISCYNYKMFFSLPPHIKNKDIIICDEASELEEEITKQFSAEISYNKLKTCGVMYDHLDTSEYSKVRSYINDTLNSMERQIDALNNKASKKKASQNDLIKLRYLKNNHNSLKLVHSLWDECEYIIDRNKEGVRIQPLKVSQLSHYLFDCGKKILLMSATIIDPKTYARSLGIKESEYEFIEAESIFDAKKAPIYVSERYKLNYQNLSTNLPKLVKDIENLCNHHKNEKGIIHTHTQNIADFIKSKLGNNKRFLFREEGKNNEDILKEHFETDHPTVLVSPSLTFGVDLKDDLARFSIICKTPYLPLSDQRIKQKFDQDSEWYRDQTLKALIQTCGRGVRTQDDHCVTYILDGNVARLVNDSKDILPKYFLNRFV